MTTTAPVATQPTVRSHVDALDGVRTLAILMVLAFHFKAAGVPFHAGGFLGVDVFFVLSGFLITSLLLAERRRTHRVSMRNFYVRRGLRLVPVAAVLFVIGLVVFVFAPASYNYRPEPIAFAALAGSWMNWLDIWRPAAGGCSRTRGRCRSKRSSISSGHHCSCWRARDGVRLRYLLALLVALVGVAVALRISAWSGAPAAVPASAPGATRYLVGLGRGAAWGRWYFGSFTHMDGLLLGAITADRAHARRRSATSWPATARSRRSAWRWPRLVALAVVVKASWTGVSSVRAGLGPAAVRGRRRRGGRGPGHRAGHGRRPRAGQRADGVDRPPLLRDVHAPHPGLDARGPLRPRPRRRARDAAAPMAWLAIALTFVVAALSYRFVETPALRWKGRLSAKT